MYLTKKNLKKRDVFCMQLTKNEANYVVDSSYYKNIEIKNSTDNSTGFKL